MSAFSHSQDQQSSKTGQGLPARYLTRVAVAGVDGRRYHGQVSISLVVIAVETRGFQQILCTAVDCSTGGEDVSVRGLTRDLGLYNTLDWSKAETHVLCLSLST